MRLRTFRAELWIPRHRNEVFPFFADALNLEALTPPKMRFKVLSPQPITMRSGLFIDYQLRVRGIPVRWQSEITTWDPPYHFVDEQRRGPYRLWIHEHHFEAHEGGTLCKDLVQYAVPFDFLMHRFFVRPDIEAIFQFRQKKLREIFGVEPDV